MGEWGSRVAIDQKKLAWIHIVKRELGDGQTGDAHVLQKTLLRPPADLARVACQPLVVQSLQPADMPTACGTAEPFQIAPAAIRVPTCPM